MDESQIRQVHHLAVEVPEYRPYIEYLDAWRRIVNENSDGWAYWHIARRAAAKLIKLTEALELWIRYGGDRPHRLPQPAPPTTEAFRKALTPIKSFATRHKLPAPTLREEAKA